MRVTGWPATRASLRLEPKGAVRAPSQAGRRAGPGHAGEGQATHSRPDPARRSGSLAHAGQRAADDDPADHRGHGCQRRAHPYRRVWHLRPPACLGVSAQNGLPRARRIRPRRGWRRVLRGARQPDRGVLVPAALLAPPAPGDLAGEAAALSRVLPVRAQRTPSRQSPAWRARRRLGRMRQIQHPKSQQEPDMKFATAALGSLALLLALGAVLTWTISLVIEARYPPRGRFVEIGGRRLHVIEAGPKDRAPLGTVVILHGASGSAAEPFLALGRRLAGHYRVLAIDRPGHGWSDRIAGKAAASPIRQAALIAEALRRRT